MRQASNAQSTHREDADNQLRVSLGGHESVPGSVLQADSDTGKALHRLGVLGEDGRGLVGDVATCAVQ